MRSVHRGNGLNDEQNTEDTLTSGVLQEALVNMPLKEMTRDGGLSLGSTARALRTA